VEVPDLVTVLTDIHADYISSLRGWNSKNADFWPTIK